MIVCICRGASDKRIGDVIARGANSLRDLQQCGIGDQCGSCHNSLRAMLAASQSAQPCPACTPMSEPAAAAVMA